LGAARAETEAREREATAGRAVRRFVVVFRGSGETERGRGREGGESSEFVDVEVEEEVRERERERREVKGAPGTPTFFGAASCGPCSFPLRIVSFFLALSLFSSEEIAH
jgi:hypothetical protein